MMYYAFAGYDYYPQGGAYDFCGIGETVEEAKEEAKEHVLGGEFDWWHIMDAMGQIVEEGRSRA